MEIKFTDNNYKEFTAKIADEEVQYLLEYAILDLMKRGVLSLEDPSEGQMQLNFLDKVDKEQMYNV